MQLAERCPNLIGFKDGIGEIELMVTIRRKLGDRFAYLGGLPTAEVYAAAYKALGVPEVWLYKGELIIFYQLVTGKYKEIKQSLALPILTSETATEFLNKGLTESSSTWLGAVREWAKSRK